MVADVPGGTNRGEIDEIIGVELFTVNATAIELPPPGEGFTTKIWLAELPATSLAGTLAFNSVALTKFVVSVVPFNQTVDVATNPVPVTSTTVPLAPAVMLAGFTLAIAGVGLSIAKSTVLDAPPPGDGFTTDNFPTAAFAKLLAGNVALRLDVES